MTIHFRFSNFILYSGAIWRILTISVTSDLCSNLHAERVRLTLQKSPDDARVTRDSAVIPRWPSAAILDMIEPEIAPFDQSTPKTLPGTRHGVDALFAIYLPLNYTVTVKLGFGVTQGHRKRHCSIEHIRLYIFANPLVFGAPVGGEAVRFTQRPLVTKN